MHRIEGKDSKQYVPLEQWRLVVLQGSVKAQLK